jgi:cyclopropane-fatty-acyl-phospholipid synthase
MDQLALEPRGTRPSPFTHVLSVVAAYFGKRLIGRPKKGAVTVTYPNGRSATYGDPATGEHAKLQLKNFSVLPKTMQRGTVGFAQAYIDGDVEIDDLTTLFRYFLHSGLWQEFAEQFMQPVQMDTVDIAAIEKLIPAPPAAAQPQPEGALS